MSTLDIRHIKKELLADCSPFFTSRAREGTLEVLFVFKDLFDQGMGVCAFLLKN